MQITATDHDLLHYELNFEVIGSNLFRAESVMNPTNRISTVKLITTQQITRLREDVVFVITATVNFYCSIVKSYDIRSVLRILSPRSQKAPT